MLYFAYHIDSALDPYSRYKRFVVEGARQHCLPPEYITNPVAVAVIEDPTASATPEAAA